MPIIVKDNELVNEELDETYTLGKRGKPPRWVSDWKKDNPEYFVSTAPKAKKETENKNIDEDGFVRYGYSGRCIVVARGPLEAIRKLNKTFRFPVSLAELTLQWDRLTKEGIEDLPEGVWQLEDSDWIPRPEVT